MFAFFSWLSLKDPEPMPVKAIDKKRLKDLYTVDGKQLKTSKQATSKEVYELYVNRDPIEKNFKSSKMWSEFIPELPLQVSLF